MVFILYTITLAVLFVQLLATPYVVTVYSKGCWSIDTDGLFNHFNVQGCGNQSWTIIDLYAHVYSMPLANTPPVSGGGDLSIILSQGPYGRGCVGGSACGSLTALATFSPPSPVACIGCRVTQLGLNPVADLTTSGNGATLASLPFINWILLIYLALAIRNVPKTYSSYKRNERQYLGWKNLTNLRRTLTVFSFGFLFFMTYQFVATWLSVLFSPVPEFGLIGLGLVLIPVTIWLARFLIWELPFYRPAAILPATTS